MDQNQFGGGNPNSLYVPMSEDEQEVLQRLVETSDLRVVIDGWGHIDAPAVVASNARATDPRSSVLHVPLAFGIIKRGSLGRRLASERKARRQEEERSRG